MKTFIFTVLIVYILIYYAEFNDKNTTLSNYVSFWRSPYTARRPPSLYIVRAH